jgi:hypothetical protein
MRASRHRVNTLAWQIAICLTVLAIWQWGYDLHKKVPWLVPDLLDPYFVSKPSDIFEHFLILSCLKSKLGVFYGWFNGDIAKCLARNENNLWIATAVTLKNTFFGFFFGVTSGFAAGLLLGRSDRLSAIFQPFITGGEFDPADRAGADHRAGLRHRRHLQGGDVRGSWWCSSCSSTRSKGARSIDEGFINPRGCSAPANGRSPGPW